MATSTFGTHLLRDDHLVLEINAKGAIGHHGHVIEYSGREVVARVMNTTPGNLGRFQQHLVLIANFDVGLIRGQKFEAVSHSATEIDAVQIFCIDPQDEHIAQVTGVIGSEWISQNDAKAASSAGCCYF